MQLLNKIRTKYLFAWGLIDVMAGAVASLALPPFFILPALCFLGLPVWRVIHANGRAEAAGIFGAAGFGWFLASTFWVSHALIVSAPALWFLTPIVALALAFILAIFWAVAAAASAAAVAAELAAGAGGGSTAGEGAVTAADAELAGKADGVGCSPWCRLVAGASLGFCWSGGHGGCVLGFFKSGSGGGCVEGAECVCSLD